ncbi:unnamed protein product [Leptosia nina]|uniref:Uncharacterized protein n=1 Tax=Leptosia nina TaxID=320188 RepID=A0AAV1K466_9NEOP
MLLKASKAATLWQEPPRRTIIATEQKPDSQFHSATREAFVSAKCWSYLKRKTTPRDVRDGRRGQRD